MFFFPVLLLTASLAVSPLRATAAAAPASVDDFIGKIQLTNDQRRGLERALSDMDANHPAQLALLRRAAKKDEAVRRKIAAASRAAGPQYRKDRIEKSLLKIVEAAGAKPAWNRPGKTPARGGDAAQPRSSSGESAPAGVPKDVWAFVQSQSANILDPSLHVPTPQRRVLAAQILAQVQRTDPKAYQALTAKLSAQGQAGFSAVFAARDAQKDPRDMAAVAAAVIAYAVQAPAPPASGAEPAGGPTDPNSALGSLNRAAGQGAAGAANVSPVAPAASTRPGDADKDPVVLLAKLLQGDPDGARKRDAAKRLNDFIWEEDGGAKFVDPKLKQADAKLAGAQLRARDLKAVETWVGAHPGDAAAIYYVLLGESGPGWTDGQAVFGGSKFKVELATQLNRWTVQGGTQTYPLPIGNGVDTQIPISPRAETSNAAWIDAFLADAADQVRRILRAAGQVPAVVAREIRDHKETPAVPGGPPSQPGGGLSQGSALTSFGPKELFGQWGDTDVLYLDGRKISVRLVSGRDAGGRPVNTIALFDISNAADVYGKTFNMAGVALDGKGAPVPGFAMGQPFALDDRARGDGSAPKQYTFQLVAKGNDTQLVLSVSGGKSQAVNAADYARQQQNPPQPVQGITLGQLDQLRQQHTRDLGYTTTLDGKSYYVMPQSAGQGCYQYMDTGTLEPAYVGCVNQKVNGQESLLPSVVGGTELLGQAVQSDTTTHYYYLHYTSLPDNPGLKGIVAEVDTKPRQQPPPPQSPGGTDTGDGTSTSTDSDTGGGTSTGTGSGTGGGTHGPGGTPNPPPGGGQGLRADGWPDMSTPERGGYVPDAQGLPQGFGADEAAKAAALNAKLSPPAARKIKFYVYARAGSAVDPGQKWIVVTRAASNNVSNLLWLNPFNRILSVDVLPGDLLVTANENGTVYTDLGRSVGADGKLKLQAAGQFALKTEGDNIAGVSDARVLAEILKSNNLMPAAKADAVVQLAKDFKAGRIKAGRFGKDADGADDPPSDLPKPMGISFTGKLNQADSGGGRSLSVLEVNLDGDRKCQLFPNPGCNSSNPAQADVPGGDGIEGKGTLMDLSAEDNTFPAGILTPAAKLTIPAAPAAADAAGAGIYYGQDAGGGQGPAVKKWYLKFKLQAGTNPPMISGPFFVFADPGDGARTLPPSADLKGVGFGGVAVAEFKGVGQVRVEPLGDYLDVPKDQRPAKGAVAVYDAPQGKATNCIGVVLWWGMSKDDALKQCQEKK